LAKDLALAKARYIEKRDHFIGLSVSFRDRLDDWNALDRTSSKNGREADSVYRHRTTKGMIIVPRGKVALTVIVPSQRAIYEAMLEQDDNFQSSLTPRSKVARFLNDALKIQDEQYGFPPSLTTRDSLDAGGNFALQMRPTRSIVSTQPGERFPLGVQSSVT
jgi:hypothetical protein